MTLAASVGGPRILALPRYDRLGASSRLRMWQYLPWLERAGLKVDVLPLFPDAYVKELQKGRRHATQIVVAYARQISRLLRGRHYDLIWIEKEVLPWLPRIVEGTILPRGVPLVLDYDDAVYQLYEAHPRPLVRTILRNKIPELMARAKLVISGNDTLAARAHAAGAKRVEVVPTVIDLNRYPAPTRTTINPPRVCWIGQRSTADLLMPYRELFASLSASGCAHFVAIGIDASALSLPFEPLPWSEDTEVEAISSCDIGIMPLPDNPFERGKCGYKLIQYMACGLAVVASPVGVNRDIVEHGVNGFLAESIDEWRDALMTLSANPELRMRMGAAGRARVEQRYALQQSGPRIAALLMSAAGKE